MIHDHYVLYRVLKENRRKEDVPGFRRLLFEEEEEEEDNHKGGSIDLDEKMVDISRHVNFVSFLFTIVRSLRLFILDEKKTWILFEETKEKND